MQWSGILSNAKRNRQGFDRSSIMTTYPNSESKSFNNHPEQDIATRLGYGEKAKGRLHRNHKS